MTTQLVYGMDIDEYHRSPALSNSGLAYLAECPAMFYAKKINPNRPSEEEKTGHLHGNLAHCAFLEPEKFGERYVVLPDDAPKKPTSAQWAAKKPSEESVIAMEWWKDFGTRHSGKRIISKEEARICQNQAANLMDIPAVWNDIDMRDLWKMGVPEVSAFWRDPLTGIHCRCRPDLVVKINDKQVVLMDVKTYSSAASGEVHRQISRKGYWRQAAHYSIGYHLASGMEVVDFVFLFVSSAYPYLAGSYNLSEVFMQHGMAEQRALIDLYAQCLKTNKWPSYTKKTQTLDLPGYMVDYEEVEVSYE